MERFNCKNIEVTNLGKENETFTQKKKFEAKNYLNTKLNDDENSKTLSIRFLPFTSDGGDIFFTVKTHSIKVNKEVSPSGFKSYICLNDPNVEGHGECPICKKSNELKELSLKAYKEGDTVNNKALSKESFSYQPKRTYITRVIDRDNVNDGVKFWKFNENIKGNGIYDELIALLNLRNNEAIEDGITDENGNLGYNIFDLYNGKDIKITIAKSIDKANKVSMAYKIADGGNKKPLTKDVEEGNRWIHDEKTWKDVYGIKTSDYLSIVLENGVPVWDKQKEKFVNKYKNDNTIQNGILATEIPTSETTQTIDENLPF